MFLKTRGGKHVSPQAEGAALVTPADADFTSSVRPVASGLYVGGAGNIRVTTVDGDDVLFSGVAAGTFMPLMVKRVWSTNTTATLIVALF
jgi:hypothetical protein